MRTQQEIVQSIERDAEALDKRHLYKITPVRGWNRSSPEEERGARSVSQMMNIVRKQDISYRPNKTPRWNKHLQGLWNVGIRLRAQQARSFLQV